MRKFKRFHRNVDDFVPATAATVNFEAQLGFLIPQLSCFPGEGVGIDLFEQPKVEQLLLKTHDFGVPVL
ncbi:hypothetical protein AB1L30_17850 [Bremerella sp. JC817]|uniref:hypothetical protein n=1 Tax=Bremerella sp. JC817 TaxID=3231756 RepID=UPI00345A2964